MNSLHLIGIGGAGMSALARVLHGQGRVVSGCDRSEPAVARLRAEGIDAVVGHAESHVQLGVDVGVSTAIDSDSEELAEARRLGLRILHRSEILAGIVASGRGICIGGAHGKTTTSALLAYLLSELGHDPTFLVGGDVSQLGTNARAGSGDLVVAEADESDGSLRVLRPACAIVLNVELDHHDHYADESELRALFSAWAQTLPADGLLVLGDGLEIAAPCTVVHAGVGEGEGWRALNPEPDGHGGTRFTLVRPSGERSQVTLGIPGEHNAGNAVAALAALDFACGDVDAALPVLSRFRGAGRRFEHHGSVGGIRLVDDYAHHPTEVEATLRAARAVAQPGRLIACFQPHMAWRTLAFAREFGEALKLADAACVCDVYTARGPADPGVSGALVTGHSPGAVFTPGYDDAADWLAAQAKPGDLVITMGAGPVDSVISLLRERLA